MEVDILIKRARRKIALKKKEEQKQLIQGEIGKVDNKVSEVAQEVNRALEVATEALGVAKTTSKQEGKKGEPGYTPVKGKDYFDGKDGEPGKDGYTPIKGKDYFDGKPGKPGKDGYTPIKGKDYFDGKDGKSIKGEPGKDGSPDTPYEIRDKLSSLKGRERLDAKTIKNLNKEISLVVSGISAPGTGGGGVSTETDPVFTSWDKDYADLTNTPTIPDDVSDLTDTNGVYVKRLDSEEITTVDEENRTLNNGFGNIVYDWQNAQIYDANQDKIADFENRKLTAGIGDQNRNVLDWETGDIIANDFVSTRGFVITRTDGYISSIAKTNGRTIDYTRDVNDYIESATDGTRTWTFSRDFNNYITGCVVT